MGKWLSFQVIFLLFVCVHAGDMAVAAYMEKNAVRCLLYGIVSLLALIVLVLTLV